MPSILITGANRGIGLELTRQFVAEQWQVHACCRSPENARDLMKLAHQHQGQVNVHVLDVTNDNQRQILADQLMGQTIDILLNNAGIDGGWSEQHFGHVNIANWQAALQINTIAPLQMMQAFMPHVSQSQRKIMANISSKMGSIADNSSGGSYSYRSSKAALNMVTMSVARDLADREICVVALHPGWVRTDMGGPNADLSVEQSASILKQHLLGLSLADSGRFIDIDGTDIPW